MGEIEETEYISTVDEEAEERIIPCDSPISSPELTIDERKSKASWAWIVIYTLFVLIGQSSATLLGRLYFNGGGNSILLAALLQFIGFPILVPFSLYFSSQDKDKQAHEHMPSNLIKLSAYILLGLFQAGGGILFAIGLQNLPVSTFSLINTAQLGFNAFFSFLLNAQNFTPPILNSLVLLTISSALHIFKPDTENSPKNAKTEHFLVGLLCTISASALYALMLSLTQLTFHKILKRETFSTVLNIIIYQYFIATCVVLVPLFASGEYRAFREETENFGPGGVWYVMIVVMIAVAWQVYSVGAVGLIFKVSSLFSNVISTVGLPVVPIFAAFFLHETMDGIKVISIVLAVWGFVSYVYHHYLNDYKGSNVSKNHEFLQELSVTKEIHEPEIPI